MQKLFSVLHLKYKDEVKINVSFWYNIKQMVIYISLI